jgi:hypothetical protein
MLENGLASCVAIQEKVAAAIGINERSSAAKSLSREGRFGAYGFVTLKTRRQYGVT